MSLEEIARTARVARSTVYQVFGSRAGLFDALADAFDALYTGRGLPVDDAARLIVTAAENAVCR